MQGATSKRRNVIERRVGTEEKTPERITLTAGALSGDFVSGGLRSIRYKGHEVLRAIAFVVRDADWGTYNPEIRDCSIQQSDREFKVTYAARCANTNQTLDYQARITGDDRGHLVFEVVAEPLTAFLTARCGFAVLHPIDGVSGQPVIIEHVDGGYEQTTFPDLIEPAQPFMNIRSIQHMVAPGIAARCRMTGDAFEMEDQRNWSDASYKTYVRPLAEPWPYVMEQGVTNRQSVELEITGGSSDTQGSKHSSSDDPPASVTIGDTMGTFPGIGVSIYPDLIPQALAHPELVRRLWPQHLMFHFDPTAGHGHSHLRGFAEIASCVPTTHRPQLVLELVLAAKGNVRDELFDVAAMVAETRLKLSGILVSPAADRKSTLPGCAWPPCPPLGEIYQAAREAFPGVAVGGGTLSYFTELNRKRPPAELLDFVSHCTCPTVHAADDLSVMESLQALPHIVRSMRAIIGQEKAYRIGPSTIGMRHNPYGERVKGNPEKARITMTDQDPRQTSLFAAAWMIGYVAATAGARLEALTVASLTGALGLACDDQSGRLRHYPAFYTASGLAGLSGHPQYECHSSRPDCVASVAGVDRKGTRVVWLANLTAEKARVVLAGDHKIHSVLLLDEKRFIEPRFEAWRPKNVESIQSLELLPYAVASLRL